MTEELIPGSRIPVTRRDGEQTAAYVETLQQVLRAARLNAFYPDSRRLAAHVGALAVDVHGGLYDETQIDVRSGLPSYREWTRVQTDVTIAHDQLHQLGPRAQLAQKAAGGPDSIWSRQVLKHDYYNRIKDLKLARLGDMDVALRRIDQQGRRGAFHVTLDKLDVSGLFVRYTIDLEQVGMHGSTGIRVEEGDFARQSDDFRGLLYKFTSLDAEFTFVKLSTLGNMIPERVTKGMVGPVWFDFTEAPTDLRPLLTEGGFVASFGLDTAAVDIAQHNNNDPFATLAEERLSREELRAYDAARERFGYRVFKDRKFVVPLEQVEAMRDVCRARGTNNIIYGI